MVLETNRLLLIPMTIDFIVALDTGIRLGELLALTWSNIDFKSAEIRVNKNLIFVKDFEGKTKISLKFRTPQNQNRAQE